MSQFHSYIYIILIVSSQEPLPFLEHMGSPSGFLWRSCFTFFSFVYIVFFTIACLLTVVGFFCPSSIYWLLFWYLQACLKAFRNREKSFRVQIGAICFSSKMFLKTIKHYSVRTRNNQCCINSLFYRICTYHALSKQIFGRFLWLSLRNLFKHLNYIQFVNWFI